MDIENSNELLEERMRTSIENYLNTKDEFSLIINGPWGSGKTFYFTEWFKIKKESDKKKSMIISLYGLTSVNDLKEKISGYNIDEDDIKNAKLTTALIDQLTPKNDEATDTNPGRKKFMAPIIEASSYLKVLSSVAQIGVNVINNNLLKNKINKTDIFIFDDFERCDLAVLDEIVPYITNNLVIENKKRVIYLSDLSKYNTELSNNKGIVNYMSIPIFEKNIKEIIHFKTPLSKLQKIIFNTIFQENSTFSFESISDIYKNETNLRHLKRQWTFLSDIITSEEFQNHEYLNKNEEDLFKEVAKNIYNSKLLGINNNNNTFDDYKSHDISLQMYIDILVNNNKADKNYFDKLSNLEYYYSNPSHLKNDINESISNLSSRLKNYSTEGEGLLYQATRLINLYDDYINKNLITPKFFTDNELFKKVLSDLKIHSSGLKNANNNYLIAINNISTKVGAILEYSEENKEGSLAKNIELFLKDELFNNFDEKNNQLEDIFPNYYITPYGIDEIKKIYIKDQILKNGNEPTLEIWIKKILNPLLKKICLNETFFISEDNTLYKKNCVTLAANVGISINDFNEKLEDLKNKNSNDDDAVTSKLKNNILDIKLEQIRNYDEATIINLIK